MVRLKNTKVINSYEKGPIRRSLFSNGAVTLFHEFKGLQSASVSLYFLVGSVNESPDEYGITHVIEHMLFKEGGKSNLVKELEYLGAHINAYTYKEYVCFEMGCLATKLDEFLPKFLSLFLNPVFDEKELTIEKQVILQELKDELDDHEAVGYEFIMQKNFDDDLGHSIGGTISKVKNFNSKKLLDFYFRFFTTERMILSVVSGKKCSKLEHFLENEMNQHDRFVKNKNPFRLGHSKQFGNLKHFKSTIKKHMESPILFYSFSGPSLENEYYYDLVVLDELLCEGLSSKFFYELREKHGLLYAMGSSINSFIKTGSYMLVFNTSDENLSKLRKKVKEILFYYKENEFLEEEVDAIKSRVNDSWQGHFDSLFARNEFIATVEMYQTEKYSITYQNNLVNRVTPQRIKKLVNKMLENGHTELVMLPK